MSSNEDKISHFVGVTRAEPNQAEHLLDASGWNLDSAVQLYFETTAGAALMEDEELAHHMMQEASSRSMDAGIAEGLGGSRVEDSGVSADGVRVPDAARTERLFDAGSGSSMAIPARPARARTAALQRAAFDTSDSQAGGLDAIYKPPEDIMSDLTLEECDFLCACCT
jgi:hypothetical protein